MKVFSYLEDREILLDTPTDKFLMSAMSFAAEIEREKAGQRVSDAMRRKALAGHVCGGGCFGYRNREVLGPDRRRSHVERVIEEQEAAVVRRIFALCAAGKGVKGIAKTLNAQRVPSPTSAAGSAALLGTVLGAERVASGSLPGHQRLEQDEAVGHLGPARV